MIGRTLGQYRIEAKLGDGGMGVVYRALDTRLDRPVAIKMLRPEAFSDPERKRRFVQEARAASALNHPNIITIYDINSAEGTDFIAMEYVSGKTLDVLIGRKGLGLREGLKYAVQATDALGKAHAAGIVHRDIKPGNIIVTGDGLVKILDFGLAKLIEPVASGAELTETVTGEPLHTEEGTILGTVAYMSPEQAEGKKVDGRSDIFSFGSVLYEIFTGQRAFTGETRISTVSAILRDDPKPLTQVVSGMPREAERIVTRCLRKDPARRFQHMDDLKVALEELKEESESGIQAPPTVRASRPLWHGAGAAMLLLALAVGAVIWQRRARPYVEPPAPVLKTVPLTSFAGSERAPALSPDGKQVAFAWDGQSGGNFDIYVQLVQGGRPLQLTSNAANDSSPAWAPDGSRIAFLRETPGGHMIFVIPALGGPERKLAQSATSLGYWSLGLGWSPNTKFLAILDRSSAQEPNSIFLLSTESGEKSKLTSPPAQHLGDSYPAFSPDGETLAFIRARSLQATDIYILPVSGSATSAGLQRLTFDEREIWGLAWHADGRSLVFSSSRAGGRRLWRIPVLGGAPEPLAAGAESALFPSISRDAARLVYEHSLGDTNIWRTPGPRAKGDGRLPTRLIASTRADVAPQFSPDGKRVVFQSNRSGHEEIWICDSDGMNPVQVTFFVGPSVGSPRWSPDGQHIAFDSTKEGQRDVYVVRAEGGPPRLLTPEASNDVRPSWSRDGRWVYFGSDRTGNWQVWKAPAEGGPALRVTQHGGREAFESADGKFVYYAREAGTSGIWRVSKGDDEETRVLEEGEQGQWALLQEGICLLKRGAIPQPAIEFFSFTTRRLAKIAALPMEAQTAEPWRSSLAVSPDGRWVLYVQEERAESDILLVENFR